MSNDIVTRLRDCFCVLHGELCREAADKIERTRAERDEARRMYCEAVILHGTAHQPNESGGLDAITDATELARRLRWDCFDVTNCRQPDATTDETSQEAP